MIVYFVLSNRVLHQNHWIFTGCFCIYWSYAATFIELVEDFFAMLELGNFHIYILVDIFCQFIEVIQTQTSSEGVTQFLFCQYSEIVKYYFLLTDVCIWMKKSRMTERSIHLTDLIYSNPLSSTSHQFISQYSFIKLYH